MAAQAVWQLRAEGRFKDGIVVVFCQQKTSSLTVLAEILARFDPQRKAPEAPSLAVLLDVAHRLLDYKDALVVLDNVEPDLSVEQVIHPLQAVGITLLVTARHMLPVNAVPVEDSRRLDLLSSDEALDLFTQSFGRGKAINVTPAERAVCERIINALGRHTLAVKLAGTYASQTKRDLAKLARELEKPHGWLKLPESESPGAVAAVFAQSLRALPREAQRLFAGLATFATNEFGRQAVVELAYGLGLTKCEERLELLVRWALVDSSIDERLPAGGDRERIRIHPLVRSAAANRFEKWTIKQQHKAYAALASYYASYIAQIDDTSLATEEANFIRALEWAHEQGENTIVVDLCSKLQYFWRDYWRLAMSQRYLPWGAAAANALSLLTDPPKNQQLAARLVLSYGEALVRTEELEQAEEQCRQALSLCQRIADRQGEGLAQQILGDIALARKQEDQAEHLYQQALPIYREVRFQRGIAEILNALGDVAYTRVNMDQAVGYYLQALEICRAEQYHREEGVVLTNLGQIAEFNKQENQARGYYHQALVVFQSGHYRQGEGVVMTKLGQMAQQREQLDEAMQYYQQSLLIRQELQDQREERVLLRNLGQMAQQRGQLDLAEQYYQQTLHIDRRKQDRPGEGASLQNLGLIALLQGRLGEADQRYQQAVFIWREMQDRQKEGVVLCQLAQIAEERSELEHAEALYQESLRIANEVDDKLGIADTLLALGRFLIKQGGKHTKGCASLKQAVKGYAALGNPREKAARQVLKQYGCSI